MLYSKSTGGFYDKEIHGDNVPSDAVEISQGQYLEMIEGQSNGKQIVGDANGRPVLVEPIDKRTYQQKRAAEYPPVTEYLDAVVRRDQSAVDSYIAACLAVKAKYPKP